MSKIAGIPVYTAEKPMSGNKRCKAYEYVKMERIGKNTLINKHLCMGKHSQCVINGKCENMGACRFGQRYIEIVREEEHGK